MDPQCTTYTREGSLLRSPSASLRIDVSAKKNSGNLTNPMLGPAEIQAGSPAEDGRDGGDGGAGTRRG